MRNAISLFQKGISRRILALVLAVCMVLTISPPITAAGSAAIKDSGGTSSSVTEFEETVAVKDSGAIPLSGFAPLPDDVATQKVAVGTSLAELVLPDTLEAYRAKADYGDAEEAPPAASEPEKSESSSSADSSSSESSSSESSSSESSSSESSSSESSSSESSSSESSSSADSSSSEASSAPPESSTSADTSVSDAATLDTRVLSAYVNSDSALTISGVTWKSDNAYDSNTDGIYTFTAVLPDKYVIKDGVSLPMITVNVGELPKWSGAADQSWYNQQAESFKLGTSEQLAGLAQLVQSGTDFKGKTILLTANIDLGGLEWFPIGRYTGGVDSKPFAGTFLGNKHIIYKLTIHQPQKNDLGLFGYSTGIIRDVRLKDVSLEGAHNVGGIAGVNGIGGIVEGCTVTGNVTGAMYFSNLVGLDLNDEPIEINYAALVDANKYFLEHQEELSLQLTTATSSKSKAQKSAEDIQTKPAEVTQPTAMTYITTKPTLEQLVAPMYGGFDVEKTDDGVLMTAGITETRGQNVLEYGFVWSLDGETPTVVDNAGMVAFHGGAKIEDFSHTLEGQTNALVAAYSIYDGMVSYTGALTTDNYVQKDGTILPKTYSAGGKGETFVYGNGHPFDSPIIQVLSDYQPIETGFNFHLNSEIGEDETVHLIIKGSIVGIPTMSINGKTVGELQSTANEEYYIIPIKGRDLVKGKNTIHILLGAIIPGWMYVDNIQIVTGGGPGEINGDVSKVEQVTFQGYNFTNNLTHYDLTVDGVVKASNRNPDAQRMITSVTVDGDKMFASQKYKDIVASSSQQTITTYNKCSDLKLAYVKGSLTLAAAIAVEPPAGSGWASQDEDEVIISVMTDSIQYEDDEGPHEYRIDFEYDKSYYSTKAKGQLQVKATVQSVFGLPVSYIMLPSANKIPENTYERDSDEGVDISGKLKTPVKIKDETAISGAVYGPITAHANSAKRVYGYETTFNVESNGAYEFKVVGSGGVVESFSLEIDNIDNQPPKIELVGASELTMLEDTPFVEMGFGGSDNRSLEEKLNLSVEMPANLRPEKPDGGEYNITYSATDQAGNKTTATRQLHIKNRSLDVVTQSVTKSGTSVNMKGNIRYLGDDTIAERGFVWDMDSSPTVNANRGKSHASYEVNNKNTFTATAELATLIPNATYYCRSYAKTKGGKVVYGSVMSFTANSKNYGVFSITPNINSGGNKTLSLTITRQNGTDGEQAVRWRTVDGSAIAGYHYRATSGTANFADGEKSKNIQVTLLPTPTSGLYRWETAPRVFFVEMLSVVGGGTINSSMSTTKASLTDTDNGKIQITSMNGWPVISQNEPRRYTRFGGAAFGRRSYEHFPSEKPGYKLDKYDYWGEHGRVQGKQQLAIDMKAADSGLAVFVRKEDEGWRNVADHWYDWGDGERNCETGTFDLTGQDYVMGRGLSQVRVAWSWVEFTNPRLSINFYDTDTPTLQDIVALRGDYKADDNIYFAARYNEIVTVTNQQQLYMNIELDTGGTVGALYETGSGTDTLVFKMKVPENSQSSGVTAILVNTQSYVEDFAKKKSNP